MASEDFCTQMLDQSCVNMILGPAGDVVLAVVGVLFLMAFYFLYKGYKLLSGGGSQKTF